MQGGDQHLALADASPHQAVHAVHGLREGGVVDHEIAELEILVEAEALGGSPQTLQPQLVGQLAEGDIAAALEGVLQIQGAMGGIARAYDAPALVGPFPGAAERLAGDAGVVLQGRGQRDDLEHRSGGVQPLQAAVQVGGVLHAGGGMAVQVVGVVAGHGHHGQDLAGFVVHHAHRAPVAPGEFIGDVSLQGSVHGDLDAAAYVALAVEQLAQPVHQRGGDVQQRGGVEGLDAGAAHAGGVAHGLGQRPAGGGVLRVLAGAVLGGGGQQVARAVGDVAPDAVGGPQAAVAHVGGPYAALGEHRHGEPGGQPHEHDHHQGADQAHVSAKLLHAITIFYDEE